MARMDVPPMCKLKQCFALLVVLASATLALGAKKEKLEHAPLPAKVLAAKTVYIQNDSNQPEIADKAYTQSSTGADTR